MDMARQHCLIVTLTLVSALAGGVRQIAFAAPPKGAGADQQDIVDSDPRAAAEREAVFMTGIRQLTRSQRS